MSECPWGHDDDDDKQSVPGLRPIPAHCLHCQQRIKPMPVIYVFSVYTLHTEQCTGASNTWYYHKNCKVSTLIYKRVDYLKELRGKRPALLQKLWEILEVKERKKEVYETSLWGHWLIEPQILSTTGKNELIFLGTQRDFVSVHTLITKCWFQQGDLGFKNKKTIHPLFWFYSYRHKVSVLEEEPWYSDKYSHFQEAECAIGETESHLMEMVRKHKKNEHDLEP